MTEVANNPLLQAFDLIPFDRIRTEHHLPALKATMAEAKQRLASIRDATTEPSFENTILALETATEPLDLTAEIFFNLLSAEADEAYHAVAKEYSPLVAAFANDLLLDEKLFLRVKSVHDRLPQLALNAEQKRLTEKSYKNFVRNGALLDGPAKARLREIDAEMATLSPQFSENLLKATYAFEVEVTDPADLRGLPESSIEAAAAVAKKKQKPNSWIFTLEAPSYIPFITYAQNRALREKLYRAYQGRANRGEFDNNEILKSISKLRHERAQLLSFDSHSEYVLQERMAGSTQKVLAFFDRMLEVSRPAALREVAEVRDFARDTESVFELHYWDFPYFSEKLKEKKFNFNEEELRPYFRLEKVIEGVFGHAAKLFGLKFTERKDVPVYHPEVQVFEVRDAKSDGFVGLLYADFFPRPTKKGGAWMTPLREQGLFGGVIRRPHVSIVCNFTKPTATKPSLLSLDEVRTLYHEFGHALHGLLSECTYRSVAGTNVYWDFVELPSQLMENWVLEKEVLDSFAAHFETGEKIPQELARKVKDSASFHAGYRTVRQVTLGLIDMAWHSADTAHVQDVEAFEKNAAERTMVLPKVFGVAVSCTFAHIFSGGYSAGYYSYKWAEVLEADAFEYFKERGLYDREVADLLRNEVLSRGGTEHPMDLYKRFRGREPDPDALLRRDGLLA